MYLSLEEQETIIRWDRKFPEASVYTHDPPLIRKLKAMEKQFPDLVTLEQEDNGSVEYTIPKSLISVRKPRAISEKEKNRLKEQGAKLFKSKRLEEGL